MREMIVLDELRVLVDESTARRVPVIVDLPATGHALSFLDTPRAVQRMFRIGPSPTRRSGFSACCSTVNAARW